MGLEQYIGFLKTPPIWENKQFNITQFLFPEISLEDFEAQAFNTKLRLGHQMEHVFKQLVTHSNAFEILLHNLPIRENKRTIGEIDFVLKEKNTQKLIHVELTYKFYIIDPAITEPIHRLVGPNRKDMFFTKMEKIKNEQFGLLHSSEGIKALAENEINHNEIEHQACYKGQLFIPFNTTYSNIRPLNKDCIIGYWLRFDDFETLDFKKYEYYIPYKLEWVVTPHNKVEWKTHFNILMDVNLKMLKENAPMVWMRKSATEFEKFFVVWW